MALQQSSLYSVYLSVGRKATSFIGIVRTLEGINSTKQALSSLQYEKSSFVPEAYLQLYLLVEKLIIFLTAENEPCYYQNLLKVKTA